MTATKTKKRNVLIGLFVLLAALIATSFAATWCVGGRLVAPANRVVGAPGAGVVFEQIAIPSKSGADLAAWYLPVEDASATVVLLHPVRTDRRAMMGRARLLGEVGYATLLIDFQAHGESDGAAITFGHLERLDAQAAVRWAIAKNPNHKIGVIGWSIGGAAALLASPFEIDALVLECVYPTIEEAVNNRIESRLGPLHHLLTPLLLAQLKPRLGIDPEALRPISHAKDIGCPVLLLCGDNDHHTTIDESKSLFDAISEPKKLTVFSGAAHVDLLSHDPAQYMDVVLDFLNDHLQAE